MTTSYSLNSTWADTINKLSKTWIGADNLYNTVLETAEAMNKAVLTYPPYNVKKLDDNKYVIEMAVAGFSTQNINITLDGDKLLIEGKMDSDESDKSNWSYLYQGISERAFKRVFSIADSIEIQNAEMINGLLKIWLEKIIPEDKKPKKIAINDANGNSKKQLLNEGKK